MQKKQAADVICQYIEPDDIVIVAPLNWGLGHATRCIPLIHYLQGYCKKVIIASDGNSLKILQREFPTLDHFMLTGYHVRYATSNMVINFLLSLMSIIKAVIKERRDAKILARKYGATVIISDNRLGFRTVSTRNYYISHQINILHPIKWVSWCAGKIHQWFISKFEVCLVPDYGDARALCPQLSHSKAVKSAYLGPISRIKSLSLPISYDICVLLSGPEPQRSYLEKELMYRLIHLTQYRILLLRGTDDMALSIENAEHIEVKNISDTQETEQALNSSKLLISRSGYSTIMDIASIEIKAIFIPTPGQTEQEYLAKNMASVPGYVCIPQNQVHMLEKNIKSLI